MLFDTPSIAARFSFDPDRTAKNYLSECRFSKVPHPSIRHYLQNKSQMKKRYVFARSLAKFDRNDVIYVVMVGSSQRDQIKLNLLQEYSKDAGCYLRPVSDESDKALDNLAKSLFSGCQWPRLMLRKTELTVSELYHLVVDDSFDSFEGTLVQTRSFFHLLHFIDPHFSLHFNVLQSDTKLPSVRRKYLKTVKRESIQCAVINFGLILLAFIVAAYVCGHESY